MANENLYPKVISELIDKRTALAPEIIEAWNNFTKTVFKDSLLPEKINCYCTDSCYATRLFYPLVYKARQEKRGKQ